MIFNLAISVEALVNITIHKIIYNIINAYNVMINACHFNSVYLFYKEIR